MIRPDVRRDRAHLGRIIELAACGSGAPARDKGDAAGSDAAAAQEISKSGHVRGKIILRVR